MKRKTAGGLAFTSEFVITHVGITRMRVHAVHAVHAVIEFVPLRGRRGIT